MRQLRFPRPQLFFLLALCLASSLFAEPLRQPKNILLLNSYHQGYQWTDDQTRGVLSLFAPQSDDVKVFIEYMGTKWTSDQEYLNQLHDTYRRKFKAIPFDAIIATDNDAFAFLLAHRDKVFGRVPTVFCGVNSFQPAALIGHELYTGVSETADFKANLDLLLRLHPTTKQIVIIIDTSVTGQQVLREISAVLPLYERRVSFVFLSDLTMDQLLEQVSRLPNDTLVLYTFFFRDSTNRFFEYDESAALISRASKVPVYGTWNFSLGHGIIGGKLTNGFDQGRMAAELVGRILRGEQPDSIPVIMQSPSRFMFDFKQMQRFGIPLKDLPAESTVINQPPSSYTFSKSVVWVSGGSVLLLSGLIIILLINIRQREQAKKQLKDSEEQYHSLVDNLNVGVYRNTGGPLEIFCKRTRQW